MNIAIIVSTFNNDITSRMLSVAEERAKTLQLTIKHKCKVPGAYDMPLIADILLKKNEIDGIVTLGTIIKGQTKHDEMIANATAKSLTELSIKYQKPVTLGISGPGMRERQANARIRPVAERAIDAVLALHKEVKRL